MGDVVRRILDALRAEPAFLCALATVTENGRPSVRTMRATIDDELVIRAPTFGGTSKVSEIRANPSVHLACGQTTSEQPGSYFRIDGRATISADPSDRRLAWNDRLNRWFDGLDDPRYLVVRIVPERIVAFPIGGGLAAQTWTADAASIPD